MDKALFKDLAQAFGRPTEFAKAGTGPRVCTASVRST